MANRPIPVRPDYSAAGRSGPNHLLRAALTMARACATRSDPQELFEKHYPGDDVSRVLMTSRAAQTPGSTTAVGWGAELVQTAIANFLGSLSESAAAALFNRGMGVDITSANSVRVPVRPGGPVSPSWVTELNPIPVRDDALDAVQIGPSRNLGSIVVMTREAMKRSDATNVFGTLLREDAARGFDGAVFSTEDGLGDAHKGILSGSNVTAGYGGGDAVAMQTDLNWLVDQVAPGGSGEVVFIGSNARAIKLGMRTDVKVTVLPSQAVADNRLIAVDPLSLVWGVGFDPEIDVSNETVLHMDDDPDAIVASGVAAAPSRSLFQTDCIATRMILPVAFGKRRDGAVAYVDGVTW